jgi:hypothetical protein
VHRQHVEDEFGVARLSVCGNAAAIIGRKFFEPALECGVTYRKKADGKNDHSFDGVALPAQWLTAQDLRRTSKSQLTSLS